MSSIKRLGSPVQEFPTDSVHVRALKHLDTTLNLHNPDSSELLFCFFSTKAGLLLDFYFFSLKQREQKCIFVRLKARSLTFSFVILI